MKPKRARWDGHSFVNTAFCFCTVVDNKVFEKTSCLCPFSSFCPNQSSISLSSPLMSADSMIRRPTHWAADDSGVVIATDFKWRVVISVAKHFCLGLTGRRNSVCATSERLIVTLAAVASRAAVGLDKPQGHWILSEVYFFVIIWVIIFSPLAVIVKPESSFKSNTKSERGGRTEWEKKGTAVTVTLFRQNHNVM